MVLGGGLLFCDPFIYSSKWLKKYGDNTLTNELKKLFDHDNLRECTDDSWTTIKVKYIIFMHYKVLNKTDSKEKLYIYTE